MKNENKQTGEVAERGDAERTRTGLIYSPDVDIMEKEDSVVVVADMPGVNENSIDVTLENGVLRLCGRADETVHEGYRPVFTEFRSGAFERSFVISDEVDHDGISARLKNGVLMVVLPKSEKVKPRKISVTAEN